MSQVSSNRVNKLISLVFLLCFASAGYASNNKSPEGLWNTIDDETGEHSSTVELQIVDGELKGKIVELVNPSEPNPICEKCTGEKKNKSIVGLEFVWGAREENGVWSGGKILDPKNGKTYKSKLRLTDNGSSLEVRGYIGISLFGRTQVWQRAAME